MVVSALVNFVNGDYIDCGQLVGISHPLGHGDRYGPFGGVDGVFFINLAQVDD